MKIIPMLLIAALAATGCTYNGKLKSGFYAAPKTATSKIPLKANLVCGEYFKSTTVDLGHIYGGYNVLIATGPALQEALVSASKSLFQEVSLSSAVDPANASGVDVNLVPSFVLQERLLRFSIAVTSASSGETLKTYTSDQSFLVKVPGGVRVLDSINIPFCGLLFPIVIPSNRVMIGHSGESVFNEKMAASISSVTESIRNDSIVISKLRGAGN